MDGNPNKWITQLLSRLPACVGKISKTYAGMLLIIVNIPLLLALIIGIHRSMSGMEAEFMCHTEPEKHTPDDYRMYCFRLGEKECLDKGYSLKLKGNITICCGNMDTHIFSIMSEELRETLQSDAAKDRILRRIKGYITSLQTDSSAVEARPAAHLGISPNGNMTGPDSGAPRVHWENATQRSFVSGGLIHGGDRLTVTKAGYYYVYTGLQFDVDPHTTDSGAIVAYIYRHVNGTRESRRKLMMARESSCKQTRDVRGPVSVYMAGIFLLRDQDEISVRTHSQSLLKRSPATTYFGMHMV